LLLPCKLSGFQPSDGHYKKGLWILHWTLAFPHVSTVCLYDITTCDQTSQTFPICICILQLIKTGGRKGLETRLLPTKSAWLLRNEEVYKGAVSPSLIHTTSTRISGLCYAMPLCHVCVRVTCTTVSSLDDSKSFHSCMQQVIYKHPS